MKDNKIFIDTNVLVYAYDNSAGFKHEKARDLLVELWDSGSGVLSIQVLQEFYITVTKKIPKPLDIDIVADIIKDLLKWDLIINDGETILEAIKLQKRYMYSFWDSMIIEAAVKRGCAVLYSEDLSHGQVIEGVEIKNPFKT